MRVSILRDGPSDQVEIFAVVEGHALVHGVEGPEWIKHEAHTRPPAFLRIREDLWTDILREALRSGGVPEPDALADAQKVRDRLLARVRSIRQAAAAGAGPVTGHGDIRDTLLALPHHPWPDHGSGAHYVSSNIFPTKHALLFAENAREPIRSVFEFGALVGYFLVTALDACPGITRVGWIDVERALPESNGLCAANLEAWAPAGGTHHPEPGSGSGEGTLWRNGGRVDTLWLSKTTQVARTIDGDVDIDVVHVDGDHSYAACLIDLTLALAMRPRLLLVDDYQAIGEVRSATDDFARYMGLSVKEISTVNGLAVIRP